MQYFHKKDRLNISFKWKYLKLDRYLLYDWKTWLVLMGVPTGRLPGLTPLPMWTYFCLFSYIYHMIFDQFKFKCSTYVGKRYIHNFAFFPRKISLLFCHYRIILISFNARLEEVYPSFATCTYTISFNYVYLNW